MQVSWPPLSIGTIIAVIVVCLGILALFLPDLWTREFVLGCIVALALSRLL